MEVDLNCEFVVKVTEQLREVSDTRFFDHFI
jgi:hypothetical protein